MGNPARPPVEPSADLRQFASGVRQMFVALVNEGFTERQALAVIGTALAATINSSGGEPS
ncbi:hypothetical protein OOJ91_12320 [Micromonospora lupini]|uniref:hypothetical protein n=1 Tax=Micromonospora lupini TaxID=285679 RepID=UPI0022510398|nr:hypothetical protein [Micromonospora lupini]MCX5066664.1 hypothetical protein [Micromonospora lupini]